MNILSNNRGIALLTVIMIIAILSLFAVVAIESTGTDIINAGNYTSSEQTLDISNSVMNIVFAQLGTNAGIGIGIPTPGVYYYTLSNNTIQPSPTYIGLTAANIGSNLDFQNGSSSTNVLGFTEAEGGGNYKFGFEYYWVCVPVQGSSSSTYYYNGWINTITQNQNASKTTVQTGMTFSNGPYASCSSSLPQITLTPTSWFQLP